MVVTIFSSEALKTKYEDAKFNVNGAQLKKYFMSILVQNFKKLEKNILVKDRLKLDVEFDTP